jgi:hypothetical protein
VDGLTSLLKSYIADKRHEGGEGSNSTMRHHKQDRGEDQGDRHTPPSELGSEDIHDARRGNRDQEFQYATPKVF